MTSQVNFGLAFLAGMASFLSPCVLPLVPAYLSYLTGYTLSDTPETSSDRRRIVFHALAFIFGFTLIFVLLGATAGALGRLLRGVWLRRIGGLVMLLFGLNLMGFLHLSIFDATVQARTPRQTVPTLASSFLAGLAFGAGWTPCVGPALSSILVLSADQQTAYLGALLLFTYAAGIGVPFLLGALLIERLGTLIHRIAPYQTLIHKAVGGLIALAGVALFTDSFVLIGQWLESWGIGWDLGI